MKCSDIGFGTYDCAYNIDLPYLVKNEWEDDSALSPKIVAIDKCLLPEILSLWEQGIKTAGCCCGHGHPDMAFIGVKPEFIPRMKELGYYVFYNNCRPGDEDNFIPKTKLEYGNADKGFNWWDSSTDKIGNLPESARGLTGSWPEIKETLAKEGHPIIFEGMLHTTNIESSYTAGEWRGGDGEPIIISSPKALDCFESEGAK